MANNKLLYGVIAVVLIVTGFVVFKVVAPVKESKPVVQDVQEQSVPTVDASVLVDLVKSTVKANTVILKVKGLNSKYSTVGYELSYDSQGLIKGVNSGSKPIDVMNKDLFDREVYLGTCSRNDCKPDIGVSKVSVALEFTDTSGKKSQFTKDYDL